MLIVSWAHNATPPSKVGSHQIKRSYFRVSKLRCNEEEYDRSSITCNVYMEGNSKEARTMHGL